MPKDLRIAVLLDFYGALLSPKQYDMVDMYYNSDLSLAEIAENEGITRQGVRSAVKKGEAALLEAEDRLGLARRFARITDRIQAAGDDVDNLIRINRAELGRDDVEALLQDIKDNLRIITDNA